MLCDDIDSDFLSAGLWRFGFADAQAACQGMRLHPDGRINGCAEDYAVSWGLRDGAVVFMDAGGRPSVGFDRMVQTESTFRLLGRFHDGRQAGRRVELRRVEWRSRPNWILKTSDQLKAFITQFGFEIGEHTYGPINPVSTTGLAKLVVGKYTSIAGCTIALENHRSDFASTYPFATIGAAWPSVPRIPDHVARGDVRVGNDVWIGVGVFIGSGVTIGDGAILGAHSVVTRDVPPYAIAVGNPARVVKFRFSETVIERLLALKWWDLPDHDVDALLPLMLDPDIEAFLAAGARLSQRRGLGHL